MTNKVFMIAGYDRGTRTNLSTVSYFDIAKNIWESLKPKLNIARCNHSACDLKGMIYVFCGWNNYRFISSIEMISETSLVQNSAAAWELI